MVLYRLHVHTGDKLHAGTSANVFCQLHGAGGSSGRVPLKSSGHHFQRNRTDLFDVRCQDLGVLKRVDIGHDNKGLGAGWYLESVAVESPVEGLMYLAPVQKWLDTKADGGHLELTLELDPANWSVCMHGKSMEKALQGRRWLFREIKTED